VAAKSFTRQTRIQTSQQAAKRTGIDFKIGNLGRVMSTAKNTRFFDRYGLTTRFSLLF
jgi:hypothetical protein